MEAMRVASRAVDELAMVVAMLVAVLVVRKAVVMVAPR